MKKIVSISFALGIFLMSLSVFSQETKVKVRKKRVKTQTAQTNGLQNAEIKNPNNTSGLVKEEVVSKPIVSEEVRPVSVGRPSQSGNTLETPKVNVEQSVKPKSEVIATEDEILNHTEAVITPVSNGSVNWTQQYIEATGISVIDNERFKNPAQARAMASRGAVVVAQRNLLEIIKGVNVTSETKVQDMMVTSDFIYTRIDGMIKGAQQIGEAIEKNGAIEVKMRVPIYEKNGLAPIVADKIPMSGRLKAKNETAENTETKPAKDAAESLEQVIFNLAGKKIDPSMFPVIVDKDNNVVLDFSKYYDAKNGTFPKLIQASGKIMEELGFMQGKKVVDLLSAENGKFVIDNSNLKKVNWGKIGSTAAKIGKFLLMLI